MALASGWNYARIGWSLRMMVRLLPLLKDPDIRPFCFLPLILLAFMGVFGPVRAQMPTAAQAGAPAGVSVRGSYADWSLRCEAGAGGGGSRENCALVQTLADDKRPDMVLSVLVVRTSEMNKGLLLRVVTPLNVNLLGRLGLKIDALDVGRAAFSRCDRFGCLAEVPFDETLINQFKTGKTAIFSYFVAGKDGVMVKEGVGFPLSLAGFDEGMQALLQ